MEIAVLKTDGKETGRKIELPAEVFEVTPNDHAIYLDVKNIMANRRQGTAKTKERSEIKGSSKKIKKQKGTGTARAGNIKNPLYRGGGRIFGPRPRSYSFKLNRKVKELARRSALSYKAQENALTVVEQVDFEAPKTKQYIELLNALSAADKKTLFVLSKPNRNIILSSRNIRGAKVVTGAQLNTYDVLHADKLIVDEKWIEALSAPEEAQKS